MRASHGFWAAVGLVLVRFVTVAPALSARGPGTVPRVAVAVAMLVLYAANTVVAARRVGTATAATAPNLIWIHGAVGLLLAAVLLSLL